MELLAVAEVSAVLILALVEVAVFSRRLRTRQN
jgi:hypothetical protein